MENSCDEIYECIIEVLFRGSFIHQTVTRSCIVVYVLFQTSCEYKLSRSLYRKDCSNYHDKRGAKYSLHCNTVCIASFRQIIHWHCSVFTSPYTPNGFKFSCKLIHLLLSSGATASSPTGSRCMSHLWSSCKEIVNTTDPKVRNFTESCFSR